MDLGLKGRVAVVTGSSNQRRGESDPSWRLAQPQEIANLVVFLASEGASYITGAVIQIDGGYTKGLF